MTVRQEDAISPASQSYRQKTTSQHTFATTTNRSSVATDNLPDTAGCFSVSETSLKSYVICEFLNEVCLKDEKTAVCGIKANLMECTPT